VRVSAEDVARLRRIVGAPTVAKGLEYAATGAVLRCDWDESRTHATGEVRGTASEPYEVSLSVARTEGQHLDSLDASCSCPVGYNCKHAVALLLANDSGRPRLTLVPDPPAPRPVIRSAPRFAEWERPLRGLLAEPPDARADTVAAAIGLQFELVASRSAPGRHGGPPGVRLRPVTYSQAGNWVRTGISWAQLEYYGYGQRLSGRGAEMIGLLKELRALHSASSRSYWYGGGDEQVWLESIASRRIWDLLGQAQEAGLPLLRTGKEGLPVRLWAQSAEVVLDVVRAGDGVRLEPQVKTRAGRVDMEAAIPVGTPAHGLVWWEEAVSAGRTPELHLAPLSQPLTPDIADLVRSRPLLVPPGDAERFERDVYPQLRRRIPLTSSDGSFPLPDVDHGDELVLKITFGDGPRLSLAWSISTPGSAPAAAAREVVAGTPGLLVPTPWGDRLADTELSGMVAVRFVSEVLPSLEEIEGLRVELLGEVPRFQEATEAPVVRVDGEESPSGDWFDLAVEVSVGGEDVPFQSLFVALAEEATHFLLPSGTYFSLDRPELRELAQLIAEARTLEDAPPGRVRLGRFQASLWEELQQVADVSGQAGVWSDAVAALSEAGDEADRPLPAGLVATLRPYQHVGFQWLASRFDHHLGGILADDMGLGKTLQALALVCHAHESGHTAPFLVVAPTSVVSNWQHEAARFAPGLRVVGITETAARRKTSLLEATAGADLVITSYALLRLEIDEYEAQPWTGLLLDEAQFAKNPASRNYQAARRIPAPFKLAMTGTPLENSLSELWALTSITAPGLFAHPKQFGEAYRVPIERQGDGPTLDRLRRRIRPVMLRRTKEQVASDLPDKQEQVLELDLHPRHRKLYQTYLQRERQKILGLIEDMDGNRFEIFRSLTLLRQAALDVALVDEAHAGIPSTKLDVLSEMLPDIVAGGHRALVFSQFTRYLTEARRRVEAAGIECCYLDGRTTKRAEVIDRFREGEAPVFLISLKAGGFGLNLTEADYCFLLDPWWNPATEAQAVDRVHRIGQTKKVMVYRLVAKETIEEKVMALKAKKAKLFASVMDGGGFESGALTASDVRDLLS
jgi:superfamily II DNA or RNA helicase